jgi:hypothetical protein
MDRTPIESTRMRSVAYDEDRYRMEIEFSDGEVYQYVGVPRDEYRGLMQASSPQTYFERHVKGVYPHTRID